MSDILTLEDSILYIHNNYTELFPPSEGRLKTVSNIPTAVHASLQEIATQRHIKMAEVIASLLDFVEEYEDFHADKLAKQRAQVKTRRC